MWFFSWATRIRFCSWCYKLSCIGGSYKISSRSLARRIHTLDKTIRKGRKGAGTVAGMRGWEIPFRSLPRTNFRRRTFTASAIVSLHAKLDYRPTVIVLQHLLVEGQRHVLRIVLFPNYVFHQVRKTLGAKEPDFLTAIKIKPRWFSLLKASAITFFTFDRNIFSVCSFANIRWIPICLLFISSK